MNIEELLDRYFEGETTCEEERILKRFFAGDNVPEHLLDYRPLFVCLGQEAQELEEQKQSCMPEKAAGKVRPMWRRLPYVAAAVAAVLLAGVWTVRHFPGDAAVPENYVVIDGRLYDDPALVQAKAMEALNNVCFSSDELEETILPDLLP